MVRAFILSVICVMAVGRLEAAEATNVELQSVGLDFAIVSVTTDVSTEAVEVTYTRDGIEQSAPVDSVKGRYHVARIEGLDQGESVDYEVRVDGVAVPETTYHPGHFTTLYEPGTFRFSFATITDTHVGESVCGLIGGTDVAGFSWPDAENPYWKFTNEAVVKQINEADVAFVIHKGDVSSDYKEEEFIEARRIFDRLQAPFYPVRGNHDRSPDGEDFYKTVLELEKTSYSFTYDRHRFLLLDTINLENGQQLFSDEDFAWFETEMDEAVQSEQPTWIFLHFAVSEKAEFLFSLLGDLQTLFLQAMAGRSPWIVGAFSGHSHRNIHLKSDIAPGVSFVETAATKEYAGSWTEVRVYTQGWVQISHPIDCPECREWYDITTGMYEGRAQEIKLGMIEDRCFVAPFHEKLVEAEPSEQDGDADTLENDAVTGATSQEGNDFEGCRSGGKIPGAWVGLVVALLVASVVRRKRAEG